MTNRQVSRSMPVGWDSSCIRRPFDDLGRVFDDLGRVFDDLGTCLLTIWGGRASGFKMPEISTSMSSTNLAVSTISLITPWLNCENDPNYNHASQLSCENNPNPLLPIKSFTMPRLDGQGKTSCG